MQVRLKILSTFLLVRAVWCGVSVFWRHRCHAMFECLVDNSVDWTGERKLMLFKMHIFIFINFTRQHLFTPIHAKRDIRSFPKKIGTLIFAVHVASVCAGAVCTVTTTWHGTVFLVVKHEYNTTRSPPNTSLHTGLQTAFNVYVEHLPLALGCSQSHSTSQLQPH